MKIAATQALKYCTSINREASNAGKHIHPMEYDVIENEHCREELHRSF